MASLTPHRKHLSFALALLAFFVSVEIENASADQAATVSFDQQIAPLLASRCLSCHNASEKKGGLDLLSEASALTGGDAGSAITAGTPDQSLLWERIAAAPKKGSGPFV